MRYIHRFIVHAPQERVTGFHRKAGSLVALTPPIMAMRLLEAPDKLQEGDQIVFRLWLGPIPVRWRVHIDAFHADGFSDRQVEGPFRTWQHRHRFVTLDEGRTEVVDEIEYTLRPHPLWDPLGLGMALWLPWLFFYRSFKTKRFLAQAA